MAQLLLSAAHKSSGKTTLTLGLCSALRERGLRVQPFKKGPDYIDPIWLAQASGRTCYNLDFNTQSPAGILALYARHAVGADLALVEGNKGLHDGISLDGRDSNAALARLLGTPVVLVLDTRGTTRGIAPLLLGYQGFDPEVGIAGVILNQVGGARHEAKLRAAVQEYTDLPVLGALPRSMDLVIQERHLGLVPGNESRDATVTVRTIASQVEAHVDLDALLSIARGSPIPDLPSGGATPIRRFGDTVRIAYARDSAFGFYYADDLEALEAAGAVLVPFDTLRDERLPPADALFIGGGFPETHAEALAGNRTMRLSVARAIEGGLPAYAECGGLMYLCRSLRWKGRTWEMVGVLPADVVMHARPQGRGYVRLRETGLGPWSAEPGIMDDDARGDDRGFPAHEFHYSALEGLAQETAFAYQVLRGTGVDGRHDGIVYRNLIASYSHLRNVDGRRWTDRFMACIHRHLSDHGQPTGE